MKSINDTKVELALLMDEATEAHPNVQRLKQKLDGLEDQLDKSNNLYLETVLAVAQQKRDSATRKVDQLKTLVEDRRKEVLELKSQQANYALLESQWQQTKRLVEILESRIKEINVNESAGVMNIDVLEVARPGSSPVYPSQNSLLSKGLMFGLMGGVMLALFWQRLDQRLRTPDELRSCLTVPLLGMVPDISRKGDLSNRGKWIHEHPNSPTAEAIRTVRTAVYFGLPREGSKVVLVTSPMMGEGKSTVVSNLAISIAQAEDRVLIVDADFRRPMQDQIFPLSQDIGLSTVMAGRCKLEDAITSMDIPMLDIMSTGPKPPNPTELLNSIAFEELIEKLRERYDYILIDSPPIMPVADARIMAAMGDATLLVLRINMSTRKSCESAIGALKSVGARVLGAIANSVPTGRRYGYGYGYGYGYYSEDRKKSRSRLKETSEKPGV